MAEGFPAGQAQLGENQDPMWAECLARLEKAGASRD